MEILIHIFEVTPQISWVGFFALLHYVWTNNLDVDHSGNVIRNHVACVANRSEGENISFLSNTKQSSQLWHFIPSNTIACNAAKHVCVGGVSIEIIVLLPKS